MSKLLRILLIILFIVLASFCCLFFFIRKDRTATRMQAKKVFVLRNGDRFTLYRNGQPFFIKGAAGTGNLARLREVGGNTLRTWDTTNLRHLLDEAQEKGIAVIAGLALPFSFTPSFYEDEQQLSTQLEAYRAIVKQYRSHPALLMWGLGNEVDFPYSYRFRHFYKAYNRLLKMIHDEDPDHPVTTSIINADQRNILNIKLKVPDLDMITINIFGQLSQLSRDLRHLSWFWKGPFLVTEWGTNGPWEEETTAWGAPIENTSTKKAEQYLERAAQLPVNDPRFLGACCFFWGQKQEFTHTWYSLFSEDGRASEVVNAMQYIWTGRQAPHHAPAVKYMLVNGKGAADNILLKPDSMYTAELLMEHTGASDSVTLVWELLDEDWFRKNPREPNFKKPANFDSLLMPYPTNKVRFRTPPAEGPYRIFVTVYDKKGYFSTANTPFYVLEK